MIFETGRFIPADEMASNRVQQNKSLDLQILNSDLQYKPPVYLTNPNCGFCKQPFLAIKSQPYCRITQRMIWHIVNRAQFSRATAPLHHSIWASRFLCNSNLLLIAVPPSELHLFALQHGRSLINSSRALSR